MVAGAIHTGGARWQPRRAVWRFSALRGSVYGSAVAVIEDDRYLAARSGIRLRTDAVVADTGWFARQGFTA
jgi:hypothetical protein